MEYSVHSAHINFYLKWKWDKNEEDFAEYINWCGKPVSAPAKGLTPADYISPNQGVHILQQWLWYKSSWLYLTLG